jgi:DNA adenine methylase
LRLARVFIENKPYHQVIQRFDKPGTFFYVDPPYWDCENDYGAGLFSREDFGRLAGLLGAVKGKFILSLNDTPGVRETFANFRIEAVKTRYSVSGTKKQEAAEVLITNFKLSTGGR